MLLWRRRGLFPWRLVGEDEMIFFAAMERSSGCGSSTWGRSTNECFWRMGCGKGACLGEPLNCGDDWHKLLHRGLSPAGKQARMKADG